MVRLTKLHQKTAKNTSIAIENKLKKLPKILRKTITYDNGTENAEHERINSLLHMQSYFCQPYHSWEKGTVENINGLVRRFFQKKTDFDKITDEQIQYVENWINNRPMKCLNFKTPNEKYAELLSVATAA